MYALGVILYRLLTGRSPYGLESDAAHELAVAICEQEPVPSRVGAQTRALGRQLSDDLDTLILMALKKDPRARYASAAQLGAVSRCSISRTRTRNRSWATLRAGPSTTVP